MIIGNPPYVDIKNLNNNDVRYFFSKYQTCENRINLYSIFIEKGFNLLNNNGVISYINPNSMLVNSSYYKLRDLIIDNLIKIVKLPDDVFTEAKVETIIFVLDKNKTSETIDTISYSKDETILEIDEKRTINIIKEIWRKDKALNFNLYATSKELSLINKIENNKIVMLEEIADFTLGITPYDKYKGHSEEIIKDRLFHSKVKENDLYKPLINGENITRYYTDSTIKEFVKYGNWLGAKREERFFTDSRIIIRQIVSGKPARIYASYSDESLYFTQIGFGIITKNKNEFSDKYLLVLLNSMLINFYHKYKYLDIEKELFQKVLIANCRKFPIPTISLSSQQPFIEKADLMLTFNKDLQELSGKFQRSIQREFNIVDLPNKLHNWYLLSYAEFVKELEKKKIKLSLSKKAEWEEYFIQENKKALELKTQIETTDKEIDFMVYKLYELTKEEIEIVENLTR